jgi:uracil-DNA glycosylase family 4
MAASKAEQMEKVAEQIEGLTGTELYTLRVDKNYKPVIGDGDLDANIMFIGEAPGENEAKSGKPFVGASGKFLSELLASIGIKREDVYITNIVKDRPPENRDPKKDEIELYRPFLAQQIDIIRPKVIVTLGRFSMDFILKHFNMDEQGQKISVLHGRALKAQAPYGEISVVPLFHPAVAFYRQDQKETLREDVKVLAQFI